MKQPLLSHFSFSVLCKVFLALLLVSFANLGYAQCPVSACVPGNAPAGNLIFGMGILNVNVNNGAINKTSPGATDGYQDYACTTGTSLTAAVAHPISIRTNPNVNENVRVWIDYNNDGIFHVTDELAFSSINNILHTGTFTIPVSAVTNTPLRMRVAADNFSSPLPTPCFTPQYSQVEDYRITVTANTSAPAPEFSASATTTCNSTVSFTDLSANGPTSWTWNFGDPNSGASNTSTLQNPTHTFSAPGTYTITLTACNAGGCNTVTKTSYITYHNNVPVAATCTPATSSYCCGYGITNVNFGNGLMTNTSVNGQAGYQDFTCSKSVTVTAGNSYPISLTSGTNPQDTRIYIDLNNDGSFTGSNEMVFQLLNQVNPSGSITIPGTTFLNTPLRMRIVSDEIGSTFNSCSGILSGQAEDYTIRINPNPNPPVAQFTSNYASACDTIVRFTDQSTNAPTSWAWDFGDPASGALNTSTLPNPVHIYHTPGTYTVTLVATNSNGPSTQTKTNYVTIVKPCLNYCPSNGHNNTNIHISNVTLSNLNNTSGQAPNGYSDFTAQTATLVQGNPATLNVSRGGGYINTSVSAWIDFNRNGIFENTERVMAQNAISTVATVVIAVPVSAPVGGTRMRVMTSSLTTAPTNPCVTNSLNLEVEDYSIIIQTNQQPPIIDFTVSSQISCTGTVQFNDNSMNQPATWLWNFGDPASGTANTSTLQDPAHVYATPGLYTVTLTATNAYGTNTLTKTNFINYDPNNTFCTTVVMPSTGTAPVATRCSGTVYDPGGATGMYPNSANGTVTIAPTGAATVTLTFSDFNLQSGADYLWIYDGPTTGSPLIGMYSGLTLPNGGTITSTGSALTLNFTSNTSVVNNGFAATWSCTMPTAKPVTRFQADFTDICTGAVPFTDVSTNAPTSWQWNFGDPASGAANTSTLQNPTHTYSTTSARAYTVTLISCNSFGCDTLVQTNYVNIAVPCRTYCVSNNHVNTVQWIGNVTLGTINNNTGQEPAAYGNYTHLSTTLMQGTSSPASVRLGSPTGGFRYAYIWIDYNKDGIFQTSERVFNGQGVASTPGGPIIVSGNIAVPQNAQTGITRMRVLMDFNSNQTNPCITGLAMGEVEDYSVNIQPNTLPTVAGFTADLNTVCTGSVQFSDASTNGATSWQWNFGDPASGAANTSTLQNPTHVYPTSTAGSYTVTLIACKNGQCDTITRNNYVNITVPCRTYCVSNNHVNTLQWISNFTLGTINNSTGQEPNAYGNYTYLNTNLTAGSTNPFTVTFGNNAGGFRYAYIWIDYNKDGVFQASERVFNGQGITTGGSIVASGSFTIPNNAPTGLTRMRVLMDYNSNQTNPCITGLAMGEVEDYSVNIQPNSLPTVAGFTADLNTVCTGTVQFTDESTNSATSWQWNFGDPASGAANTSTLQNPTHVYPTSTAGSYTVTLIACKNGQCNTVTKTNFVNIAVPCRTYCVSNNHVNTLQWISNFTLGTINNSTGQEPNAYGNYTYLNTNLTAGSTNPFTVTFGNNAGGFRYAYIWIDWNKDGIFQASERVFNGPGTTMGTSIGASGSLTVPNNAQTGMTRMRVLMDYNSNQTNPCITGLAMGEVEDYTVNIQPNTLPTVAGFTADLNTVCTGSVQFTDESTNGATSWQWNFGDPASGTANTSTLQNPIHAYPTSTAGSYSVTLIACKGAQCDTVTRTNYVNITVPCRTYCVSNNHNNTTQWISNVTLGTLNNTTGAEPNAYGNYTYLSTNLIAGSNNPVSVTQGFTTGTFRYVTIWIDFNKDGTFQTTERVFNVLGTNPSGSLIVSSGSIAVPNTAASGTTRMRVIMSSISNLTTSCAINLLPGETEDYTVNILPNTTPPVANFTATPLTTCNGLVTFTDGSTNIPTSWSWNFGDPASGVANTSTLQNPTHSFSAPGLYTVTLTATNANGSHSETKTNYINYDPNAAACRMVNMPVNGSVTSNFCSGTLYDDGGATGFYSNYVNSTVVIAPTGATTVSLTFSQFMTESGYDVLYVYDGPSTASRLIGSYTGSALPNGGLPIISTGGALTVRFTTDGSGVYSGFVANWNCIVNTLPPTPGFTAIPLTTCNGLVTFTDTTRNYPTSWQWNFGDPASGVANTSTLQNPTHTFSAPGMYTVTLTTCNANGCNTITRSNYINYDPNALACRTVNMPVWGTVNQTACSGMLYDDGGPANNYSNGVSGTVVIAPAGASTVSLTFTQFMIESGWDMLYVYDGSSTGAPLLGSYTGSALPNGGLPITSTGGALTVRFTTDGSGVYSGFEANWNCNINTSPPVANFTASPLTTCNGLVNFTDASTNFPTSWSWNFGDPGSGAANTSTLQNPTHTFSAPGMYTVMLTATNAHGSHIVTKTNYINYDPNAAACRIINMPASSTVTTSFCSGTLYDNGGPTSNYSSFANGTVVIAPTGATNVSISFAQFITEPGLDVLYLYDGPSAASPLIGSYSGFSLPNGGLPITSSGGALTIRFSTSGSGTFSGFEANWNCLINTSPPIANFTASPLTPCNGLVNFTDASTRFPTSWSWNFGDPGSGAANTSTLQNPTHNFSAPGIYTVTLTATNANGSNTTIRSNYINYDPNAAACRIVNMPVNGSVTSNFCSGTLYDDGGPANDYSNNANGTVVIAPVGASAVSLTFTQFATQSGFDIVYVYDGPSTASPLIATYSGSILPHGGLPITSSGGALTIRFSSNGTGTYSGFVANWNCVINTAPPIANFTASPLTPCNGLVNFTDASTGFPTSWNWNFGDPGSGAANTSALQNPTHTYATPGVYTVTLTVSNANGTQTITRTNYINYDPNILACRTVNMPSTGNTTAAACTGTLYDDGGPGGNYSNGTSGYVVIAPFGATNVALTFTQFSTESGWDVLWIYDGSSLSSPVIGTYSGNSLPNGGLPIVSSGGALTVRFGTNGVVNDAGFAATWTCNSPVGLAESRSSIPLVVYPNPSTGMVNLKLGGNSPDAFQVEVTNVLGEVLMKKPVSFTDQQEQTLDLSRLAKGVYFIRLQNGKTSTMRKVVLE
ncbi:PKD domain-containing protein [Adhaeribacter soli]|uniref:PKD domain-containing protein n=1 Tax=Adhaeribacter soli TaxID=2607655 RepID=A0A5N1J3J7_9BACT|nr:PKD domain-containing protein [Adhaeribacter soli]KAA9340326.1 PKD domain-containing protein [Adhaeribacter soli]